MSPKSFAVRIFLADGTIDGVKIIAKSKWSGRGMVIPRPQLPQEIEREELDAPGVYVLIGPTAEGKEAGRPTLFIGCADPVCDRLGQHQAATGFWTSAIIFTSKKDRLQQSHIEYITARLIQLAEAGKQVQLANPEPPPAPELTADEQAEVETFIEHILSICPLLGLTAFEKPQ